MLAVPLDTLGYSRKREAFGLYAEPDSYGRRDFYLSSALERSSVFYEVKRNRMK